MGEAVKSAKRSIFKIVFGTFFGLCAGAGTMYFNTAFNAVVRPSKPVANFTVAGTDGLTASFAVKATGDSGWWDFGDGSELEPFDPTQPAVTHTYTKPGTYSTKLIVRNFMRDEADRSVAVDLSAAVPPAAATSPPKLLGVQVQKFSDTVPAGYRITGEVQHADELVWAYGEQREHLPVLQPGRIDKFVTIDKAGPATIMLTALSKSKATPDVFVHAVSVTNPTQATFDVRLDVRDVVARTASTQRREMLSVRTLDGAGKPTPGFTRTLTAAPGATIKAAELDIKMMRPAGLVKHVKTQVAADGQSATVTGEWGTGVNVGEVFVPVLLNEERTTTSNPGRNAPVFLLTPVPGGQPQWQGSMKLPPAAPGTTRKVSLTLELTGPDGKRTELGGSTLDATGNWSAPLPQLGAGFGATAQMANGEIKVTVGNPAPTAAPAPTKPKPPPTAASKK